MADYDTHYLSALYEHDKEKDRRLNRRKKTKHIYNKRYKIAKSAETTYHWEGYYIKDETTYYKYKEVEVPEKKEAIYERVWGLYPSVNDLKTIVIGNNWEHIYIYNENCKLRTNYEDILIGYRVIPKHIEKVRCGWGHTPLKHPILKRSGSSYSYKYYSHLVRNISIYKDIGTAPSNFKRIIF